MLGICLVTLLVIGLAYFGMGYLNERDAQQALVTKMDDTNKMLTLMPKPPADLQQRLADAQQANLAAKQNLLPDDVDTTQVIKTILAAADECHVNVIPLTTDSWTTVAVQGNNYRVLTISLSIEGIFADLTAFVNRFYGNEFATVVVDTFTIQQPSEQIKGPSGNNIVFTGTLELAIYTQSID
ncbi:MAG: hypothetical protein PHY28_07760 [Dehalococcoidales bacterium]|nr:hypothetical protein [Dehalococcoidales bacterium]